jgi:hypothetical protein
MMGIMMPKHVELLTTIKTSTFLHLFGSFFTFIKIDLQEVGRREGHELDLSGSE